jgi:hypothetical protein
MAFRKISERDVLAVLASPVKTEPAKLGRTNFFGVAPNGRPIRITLDANRIVWTVTKVKRSRVEEATR